MSAVCACVRDLIVEISFAGSGAGPHNSRAS
jgi:hypothetical protein